MLVPLKANYTDVHTGHRLRLCLIRLETLGIQMIFCNDNHKLKKRNINYLPQKSRINYVALSNIKK